MKKKENSQCPSESYLSLAPERTNYRKRSYACDSARVSYVIIRWSSHLKSIDNKYTKGEYPPSYELFTNWLSVILYCFDYYIVLNPADRSFIIA